MFHKVHAGSSAVQSIPKVSQTWRWLEWISNCQYSLQTHCHSGLTMWRLEKDQGNHTPLFSSFNVPIKVKIKIIQSQIQFWNIWINSAILQKTGQLLSNLNPGPKWVIAEKYYFKGTQSNWTKWLLQSCASAQQSRAHGWLPPPSVLPLE